jgi:hypothetical protein
MSEDLNTVAMWREINKLRDALNRLTGSQLAVYETTFIDYSAISTIVGWTSYTTKLVWYRQIIVKHYFVQARIVGTSNSLTTSITLPSAQQGGIRLRIPVQAIDNGGAYAWGVGDLPVSSNVLTLYPTLAMGNWTAGGTKEINVAFEYEAA